MVDIPAETPAADSSNADPAAVEGAVEAPEAGGVVSSAGGLQIVSLPDTRGPTSTLAVSTAADAASTEAAVATSEAAVSGMFPPSVGNISRPFADKVSSGHGL